MFLQSVTNWIGIATRKAGATRAAGKSSTHLVVYLVLVSISSIAFATVKLQGKEQSRGNATTASAPSISRATLSESICLNPSYVSNSRKLNAAGRQISDLAFSETLLAAQADNYSVKESDEQIKVLLTSYPGSIRRFNEDVVDSSELDRPNSVWNPLAKVWLTAEQVYIMNIAFDIAFQDGGLQHARLIQGMLFQETLAGLVGRIGHMTAPAGKRSYGVMQVKVTAANDVLARYASLGKFSSDKELITHLIVDDAFNIRVASKHFLHLRARTKTDNHALLAYNIGLRASRRYSEHASFRYVQKVNVYAKQIANPLNNKFNSKATNENRFSPRQLKISLTSS